MCHPVHNVMTTAAAYRKFTLIVCEKCIVTYTNSNIRERKTGTQIRQVFDLSHHIVSLHDVDFTVQGDQAACPKPLVDIDVEVVF